MNTASRSPTKKKESQPITAFFYVQDFSFTNALRELFSSMGTAVIMNGDLPQEFTYLICAGDSEFVKAFYNAEKKNLRKSLFIVYGEVHDNLYSHFDNSVKLYIADAIPLTKEDARALGQFFFVGGQQHQDGRKERQTVLPQKTQHVGVAREEDIVRIKKTIDAMYDPRHSPKKVVNSGFGKGSLLHMLHILLGGMCAFLCIYIATISIALFTLFSAARLVKDNNMFWSLHMLRLTTVNIQIARSMVFVSSPLARGKASNFLADQQRFLGILESISRGVAKGNTIIPAGREFVQSAFSPSSNQREVSPMSSVIALRSELSMMRQFFGLAEADLKLLLDSQSFPFFIPSLQNVLRKAQTKLESTYEYLVAADNIFTIYPHISGYRSTQTYLVLLQNSMELRPTGGFIGSLAKVTFLDGKLQDYSVLDVYTVDGQLKGHVEPPPAIAQLLTQEHWYLRDSNWDPNFSISGAQAAWFFEKETGIKVDGVIAVSLPVLTRLLSVTGPIELPDFNEHITADNFFTKSLVYTQQDFFPGSTQKKDFLGSLLNALLFKLTEENNVSVGQLINTFTSSLQTRDIQVYTTDPKIEEQVAVWGWSGKIPTFDCLQMSVSLPCAGDGRFIAAANVGVNKVNYFVKTTVTDVVHISEEGEAISELQYNIQNTSPNDVSYGGLYRGYIRFYYPPDTELVGVQWRGVTVPVATDSSADVAATVAVDKNAQVVSFGMLVSVSAQATEEVIIKTRRKNLPRSYLYSYTIQKQAGVELLPWNLRINDLANGTALEYNTDLTRDAQFVSEIQ